MQDVQIKAIPTKFDGYQFRSRTEARWAVFFKHIGLEYIYEHEGFELESGRYLPDFYLPKYGYYVEIKGTDPSRLELDKIIELVDQTKKPAFIVQGIPSKDCPMSTEYKDRYYTYIFEAAFGESTWFVGHLGLIFGDREICEGVDIAKKYKFGKIA